ncbi:glutathione S-transferase [Auriculariales sp. MPI-PUGE-AT-0066]|nr:glutathione S-transferase [Auriculariales sp. MPI-PUGE-AT-0066]
MAPVLHGTPVSTCTQRVLTVLKELNLDLEIDSIGRDWAKTKTPEWIAKQPFGQVPYLEDGSFILTESRAITKYVVAKYGNGSSLLPPASDLEATARFDAAASIEQANFDKFASDIAFEKVFKLFFGQKTDEARVTELVGKLEQKLDGYERILSKSKYLAGDVLTIVDLAHLPYGWKVANDAGIDIFNATKRPNLARWWSEISSRESWKSVIASA